MGSSSSWEAKPGRVKEDSPMKRGLKLISSTTVSDFTTS